MKKLQMKSIKNQLILITLILVLVPFIVSNIITSAVITRNLESEMKNNNTKKVASVSNYVSEFIDKAYVLTEELSWNNDIISFNGEQQKEVLVNSAKRNQYFDLLYVQDISGMQTAKNSGALGDRSNRWWFQQITKDKKPFVSKSYYSLTGNVTVTSIFSPIYDKSSKMIGVMGADLKLDALQEVVEKFSDNGVYTYIIDGEGVVIAHPDKNVVREQYNYKTNTKTVLLEDRRGNPAKDDKGNEKTEVIPIEVPNKLKEISQDVLAGKSGIAEYIDQSNQEVVAAYTPITISGQSSKWAVIMVQNKSIAMAAANSIKQKNIISAAILIMFVAVIIYFVAGTFVRPIVKIKNLLNQASKGDLSVHSDYKSENELGQLSDSFNNMTENMRGILNDITKALSSLFTSSEILAANSEQTAISIDEVARSISQVAEGASSQVTDAFEGVKVSSRLSEEIDIMAESIQNGSNSSKKILQANNNGLNAINTLKDKTAESNKASQNTAKIINDLYVKTNEVDLIVETITAISSQTNLLALNAAIEAARAGEAGKGFAVVAEEVRKLAQSTSASSANVKNIINLIKKDIDSAKTTIKEAEGVVEEQNNAVSYTSDTFNNIGTAINEVVGRINDMSNNLKNIMEIKDKLLSVIENTSSVSEETAAAAEEVSATTEEQSATIEQMSNLAVQLDSMTKELKEKVKIFKL